MDKSQKTLSDIIIYTKYAKYIPHLKRRETWDEIVDRYLNMMVKKYPSLKDEIKTKGELIRGKRLLPSMRSLQFAGDAILKNNARLYNCSYSPVDHYTAFSETMFLLLSGCGVGFSVQKHHIAKLPAIQKPTKTRKFVISDDIEGWAQSIKILMKSYFGLTKSKPVFDYSCIREKGERLVTSGGRAPGAGPLKVCIAKIDALLGEKPNGYKLSDIDCHDIICYIADAVLAGGIRRSALISLFSKGSTDMMLAKHGSWWELNPQRGRANNSVILLREGTTEEEFNEMWEIVRDSGAGEPGVYHTSDVNVGTNPCFSANTNILTAEGLKPIVDCVGELDLINKEGEIVNGIVWSNGIKPVVELTLSNKLKIKCTPDHEFMLTDESSCHASNLKGKRLMSYFNINQEVSEFTKYGFIQGDGGLTRLNSDSHKGLEIHIGENDEDIFSLFGIEKEQDKRSYYTNGFNEILRSLRFDASTLENRVFPSSFLFWKIDDKKMFVKGMYSANGSVIKAGRVSYKTTSKGLAMELLDFLSTIGIRGYITTNKSKDVKFSNGTYTCKESYDVNISNLESIIKFANEIGFVHQYKQQDLRQIILDKSPKVISIKDAGEEEVFDFNLDDGIHWGVIENIIAHNCCEISLRPFSFCNLCDINAGEVTSQDSFNEVCEAGAFFGTLQAGFTDFHYLREEWINTTEEDALVGVGITGICSGTMEDINLKEGAEIVKKENERVASIIGINVAARTTTIKPSGNSSALLGCSSGIHEWFAPYYIRSIQCGVGDDLYNYFTKNHPKLIKVMDHDPRSAVIGIPQKAPKNAILRNEVSALQFLERVARYNKEWVREGHNRGINTNNVSATCNVKNHEWDEVGKWMWDNRDGYNGLSVLPYDDHTYKDAPFQECTKEEYEERLGWIEGIDLTKIIEDDDNTNLSGEVSCAGGACDLTF